PRSRRLAGSARRPAARRARPAGDEPSRGGRCAVHPALVRLLIVVWGAAMWLGFVYVFPVLFAATLVVAGAAALGVYYLHACRTLAPSTLDGPSPVAEPKTAYRHYLLGQGWRGWWTISRTVVPQVYRTARAVIVRLTRLLLGGFWGFFVLPVWLALCAGIVAAAVPAAVFVAALTVLYGLVAAAG